jgi:hypothetical protein
MKTNHGYIALSSLLVVLFLVVLVGISTTLLSINDLQSSVSGSKSEEVIAISESCAEDILIRFNGNQNIPSTITLPEGACSVTINSQDGGNIDFTVSSTMDGYSKKVRIQAERGSTVSIISWQEII